MSFLTRPAPIEPTPPQPLVPSRLVETQPASASPLADRSVFQRGTFIHLLLQYLPQVKEGRRKDAGARMASLYAKTLPPDVAAECVREALMVMESAEFAFLFAAGSLAEVPVAGCVDIGGKEVAVSGQIDRLAITGHEVWIVDFKSNQTVPAQVPVAYLRQMQLYRALMQRIYPGKTVRCALLWTAEAKLVPLDDALLDESAPSSYI